MNKIAAFFISLFFITNLYGDINVTKVDANSSQINDSNQTIDSNLTLQDKVKVKKTIFNIIDEIISIDINVDLLNSKLIDKNSTIFSDDIASLNSKKAKLLEEVPIVLINGKDKIDEENIALLSKSIKELSEAIKKIRNKKSYEYFAQSNQLLIAQTTDEFYKFLFQLKEIYLKGPKKNEIDDVLKNSIIEIQNTIFDESYKQVTLLSEVQKQELGQTIYNAKLVFKGYEDILTYILKNSDIFAENIIVKNFKLKDMINYINQDLELDNKYFNAGKIFAAAFITLFLFLIRKLIYNIVYFILKKTILRVDEDEIEKASIIGAIKNPISALLFLLNVDLWFVILNYPAPTPITTADILSIVYILFFSWFVIGLVDVYGMFLLGKLAKKSGKKEILNLATKLIKILITLIAILLILRELNFDITTLIASFGIGGLAIAFASKDIVANFFTSIVLIFDNSFSQGDWVIIDGTEGTIVEIGLRKTAIRTFENSLVFIPNSVIIGKKIENWSRRKLGRQIKLKLNIAYGASSVALDNTLKDIKNLLINNPKIAKSNELNSYKDVFYKYKQDMVSIDDLAGYKNSMSVNLDNFETHSISLIVSCFTKTIDGAPYKQIKEDVMFGVLNIIEQNGLDLIDKPTITVSNVPNDLIKAIAGK